MWVNKRAHSLPLRGIKSIESWDPSSTGIFGEANSQRAFQEVGRRSGQVEIQIRLFVATFKEGAKVRDNCSFPLNQNATALRIHPRHLLFPILKWMVERI